MCHLRKEILTKRDSYPQSLLMQKSLRIYEYLRELSEFSLSLLPLLYVSFRSEVYTHNIIKNRIQEKKRVSVPLTNPTEKKIIPYEINDFSRLKKGFCGILEPDPGLEKIINPLDIDCIIVPGSVFDKMGSRFGYGGGYYDRFFPKCPNAIKIALAYDFQVLDFIPVKAHDVKMDIIVTEKEVIKIHHNNF